MWPCEVMLQHLPCIGHNPGASSTEGHKENKRVLVEGRRFRFGVRHSTYPRSGMCRQKLSHAKLPYEACVTSCHLCRFRRQEQMAKNASDSKQCIRLHQTFILACTVCFHFGMYCGLSFWHVLCAFILACTMCCHKQRLATYLL